MFGRFWRGMRAGLQFWDGFAAGLQVVPNRLLRREAVQASPGLRQPFLRCIGAVLLWFLIAVPAHAATSAPVITQFSPSAARPGSLVIIYGSNLIQVLNIEFNGAPAPVFGGLDDGTAVQTQVPTNATTGPVTVATANGTTTSAEAFQVISAGMPVIDSFSPSSGPIGTAVTINGTDLVDVTQVSFNGAEATFSTFVGLVAYVPTNATTGPITVTTKNGSVTTRDAFTVAGEPVITDFSPTSGSAGVSVTIRGSFSRVTQVLFGGVASDSVAQMVADSVWAHVPLGAKTGPITVVTETGSATSTESFEVTALPPPVIASFSPTSGRPGSAITVSGKNLFFIKKVEVSGIAAAFTPFGAENIFVQVPYAPSGPITVTCEGGIAVSDQNLIVIGGPAPAAVLGFTPVSGVGGTLVTIHGTNLWTVHSVSFNGIPAAFDRYGDTLIAEVPAFATSGPIAVQTSNGDAVTKETFATFNSGDLGLLSTASRDPLVLPQPVTFAILLTNLSTVAIDQLELSNAFAAGRAVSGATVVWSDAGPALEQAEPANIEILQVTTSQGTHTITNNIVVCALGSLPVAGSLTITIDVLPRGPQWLHLLSFASGARPGSEAVYGTSLSSVLVTGSIELTVRAAGLDQLEVAWPIVNPPLVLQSCDSLLSIANWTDLLIPVTVVDGRNTALVPISVARQFYRLVRRSE